MEVATTNHIKESVLCPMQECLEKGFGRHTKQPRRILPTACLFIPTTRLMSLSSRCARSAVCFIRCTTSATSSCPIRR